MLHKSQCEVANRDEQVQQLNNLLNVEGESLPPSIFIYGHPSTGKTYTVTKVLRNSTVNSVFVNCVEVYSQKLLYQYVLKQVTGDIDAKCDNMLDFIHILQSTLLTDEPLIIVLDYAERLRNMEFNLLSGFPRLQEISKRNICTVFISRIPIEGFYSNYGVTTSIVIYFPQYTKDQLIEIIAQDCPSEYPVDFYKNFLRLILSVFFTACRDLQEIRYLASLNFPLYVEPIKQGEATVDDLRKLWRNIEPHLKKSLQTIYLREMSSAQWCKLQDEANKLIDGKASNSSTVPKTHVELPFYSKFLLIASYLASYNPSKSDKRFFVKGGKTKKFAKTSQASEKNKLHLVGPKPFLLNRMLAIFYKIVDEKVTPSSCISTQISSMVTLNLISQLRSEDPLDAPKYKCLVSLNFIKQIAKNVNFEIMNYLYDFV